MSRRRPSRGIVDETLDWVTAFFAGLRDTASDMLQRGREGAAEAYDEAWDRYDAKTKHRRRNREDRGE